MKAQIIEKKGKPEWAIIPFNEYKKIREILEDSEDIRDITENMKAIEEKKEIAIPGDVTFAIIDGKTPIRSWREYKNIKIKDLAKDIGISSSYLSQIEHKKRNPTIDTLKALAQALDLDIEMLI